MYLKRPVESIERLMSALNPGATAYDLPRRRLLDIPVNEVWLVERGMVAVYRNRGQQLVYIAASPLILGVRNLFASPTEMLMAEFLDVKSIAKITPEDLKTVLDEKGLWKDMANLISFYLECMLTSHYRLVQRSDYEIIKGLIYEYTKLSDYVKERTTLAQYIIEKGLISRSNVLRILSILNKNGCITTTKGRLLTVMYLPEKL